jgi:hypothetical protein
LKTAYALLRLKFAKHSRATLPVILRRRRSCKRCAIYFEPLRSCGSPLASGPALGCWCNMEHKAALPDATCWLNEQGITEYGWASSER